MKNIIGLVIIVIVFVTINNTYAQKTKFYIGDKTGLHIVDGSASVAAGPMFEVKFLGMLGVGTEINVNSDALVDWETYFKFFFNIRGTKITPYINAGFGLWFASGGPYFALRFGGGAYFPINKHLYIPADFQLGPIFGNSTVFHLAISTGIRYEF